MNGSANYSHMIIFEIAMRIYRGNIANIITFYVVTPMRWFCFVHGMIDVYSCSSALR